MHAAQYYIDSYTYFVIYRSRPGLKGYLSYTLSSTSDIRVLIKAVSVNGGFTHNLCTPG